MFENYGSGHVASGGWRSGNQRDLDASNAVTFAEARHFFASAAVGAGPWRAVLSCVAKLARQVSLDLYAVVQDAVDADQAGVGYSIEQPMSGPMDAPLRGPGALFAVPQVIAAHGVAEFRPRYASKAFKVRCNVPKTHHKQSLIA